MNTSQSAALTLEEIHLLQTEIRDLKNTVTALRGVLEQEKIDKC